MAYKKYDWVTGDPITQEKMNHIEQGIEDAQSTADTNATNITGFNSRVEQLENNVQAAENRAETAQLTATQALSDAQDGHLAWVYVEDALIKDANTQEIIKTLAKRLEDDEKAITDTYNHADAPFREVENARGRLKYDNKNNIPAENLRQKLDNMEVQIDENATRINSSLTNYDNAKGGYSSLMERLVSIDGDGANQKVFASKSLASHVTDLENILINTPGPEVSQDIREKNVLASTANGTSYNSLDARLEADETTINNLSTNISNLTTDKISYNNIVDNLTSGDTNKPLSANQGRILKNIIGQGYDVNTTVATGISNAQTNAQTYADTNKVDKTDIYNGVDYTTDDQKVLDARVGKTLQDAIDTIDSDLNTANTGLVARVGAAEDAITTLNSNASTSGSVLNTVNSRIAEVVNNAPEAFDTLKEIADWIGNNSDDALTMQTNISNNTSAISALDTRLTAIDNSTNGRMKIAEDDIDALETTIGNSTSGLIKDIADNSSAINTINNAISHAASGNDPGGLDQRIAALENEPKSATVVITADCITYNNETGIPTIYIDNAKTIAITPTQDADYLLENTDGKYYYWKYIGIAPNGTWELISGANGGGSSSGEIVSELPQANDANENTDYFVGNNETGYLHYRFTTINGTKQAILIGVDPNNIKNYALTTSVDNESQKNYIDFYSFNYGVDSSEIDQGTRIAHIEMVGGGGGGTYNSKTITRITPRSGLQAQNSEEKVLLRFFYTSGVANESDDYVLTHSNATTTSTIIRSGTIDSGDPADASNTWPTEVVDGETVPLDQSECDTGFYVFDVTNYCTTLGKQTFTLTISDPDDSSIYTQMKWEITVINLVMRSEFSQNYITNVGNSINFIYIPESGGNIEKTAYFYLDGNSIGTVNLGTRANTEQTFVIPAQNTEGVHQLSARLGTASGNKIIYSEFLYRDIIWRNTNSVSTIISSPCRGRTIDVKQYNAVEIPYTIAGTTSSYTVQYFVDNMSTPYNEVVLTNKNSDIWTYRPYDQGTHTLRIKTGETYIDVTLNVLENEVDIAPYIDGLILNFDPTGLSNNSETAKNWTNGTYHLTTSENFDWQNGGYGSDASGDYFLIKSGTRAYFDYKMFTQEMESVTTQDNQTIDIPTSKVYRTGQEMKLIFKTSAVRAIDAVWFTNAAKYDNAVDKTVGIQLSAHEGWLRTDSASDVAVTQGDEQVAATNTYLYFPYSEEDRIELDININKEDSANGAVTMSYEDGVPSKAYAYTHNQKLYHVSGEEAIITIGSDDCDVYIYKLKIYNKELTQAQVLRNFIADGRNVDESIARYERNCIYYDVENDEYSPYLTSGFELNPEALAKQIPNVKVLMLDTPTFTLNKKSFIKGSTLRCIHADGGTIYPSRGAQDNWYFENGYHAGQGTTSDKYGDAGRNIDFLFNCDGSHKPSDKVDPDASYISQVTTGYGTDQAQVSVVSDWKGDSGKVSLTNTSIPNNFFNFKVNIASSENVNNALLQKRYNDFLPYISPAKARDARIKNDMEFVPAVLFVRENSTTAIHSEFGDTDWHFYALGNLGDSKKTDYTRAYDPDDINEFTIEISDNNTNNSQFQTGVYMVNGVPTLEEFEAVQDIDDDGNLIDGSYTAQGRSGAIATTDYVYPLDTPQLKALWDATDPETGEYLNKNHWSLVNEPYDGDHSFEMRYAFYGNFRDGKLVNGNKEESKAIQKRNSKVWQAFYSWIVTSSNEEFVRDLDQWCVRSAVEFWYAFTHYYTMMDNRAKNTFWHFAKTGKHRRVLNPIKDMLHTYDESSNAEMNEDGSYVGTFTRTEDTVVDPEKTYYTEYAFDLWDYDNDTALGIDNNGELIFPYGKEDSDYKIGDNAASGYVFNGAGSVFWRRLRDLCSSEISSIFNTVNEQFFSAENLIESFDNFQSCYPEAIWQLDVWRKYIRPFIQDMGKNLPNGSTEYLTRKDVKFLETMMQGRKKYQRRQWIRDQYYYFGSKYKLNNVTEDFFLLDCYTGPDDALIAELKAQGRNEEAAQYVGSNWDITITPYQDMYINASFGETAKAPVRAKAGQPVEMTCPFTSMNNTRIYIYGASRLSALAGKAIRNGNDEIIGAEGLASLYVGNNRLQRTAKLQHLYLGTDKSTYRNANLTNLALNENSPILETLDIRNCGDIAGELKLGGCNNLRILEAEGTSINLVTLPSSSQIETLHLPSSVTSLSLSAVRKLDDFYIFNKTTQAIDYTNLRSLLIDSSDKSDNINWLSIASENLSNYNYLYLLNLEKSSVVDIDELAAFAERKKELEAIGTNTVTLSGIIYVSGAWSIIEAKEYTNNVGYYTVDANDIKTWHPVIEEQDKNGNPMFPNLQLIIDPAQEQAKHKVTYRYNNKETIIYVNDGTTAPEIYPSLISEPTKESTPEYSYIFGSRDDYDASYIPYSGWRKSTSSTPLTGAPIITEDTILVAYFIGTKRQYYVRWWLSSGKLVATSARIDYGTGETLEAPTIKAIHEKGFDTCSVTNSSGMISYSIFKGWEHLPISNWDTVDGSTNYFDIYGLWETGNVSISNLFASTTNLTPIQLLAWSILTDEDKVTYGLNSKIDQSTSMTYRLGQDCDEEATVLVSDNSNPLYLNGTSNSFSATTTSGESIKPLNATNNAFTFVIDYTFNDTTYATGKNYAVLASCYYSQNGVRNGFAVFKNINTGKIEVGFGDMYRYSDRRKAISNVNNANMRNILVIRHAQNSPTIQIYSGLGDEQTIPVDAPYMTSISQAGTSTFSAVDAILNIGQIVADTESIANDDSIRNTWTKAVGTVYWSKFWNKDLGLGECKRLASWPHEYTTLSIAYSHRDPNVEIVARAREDTIPNPTLYLASSNALMHGLVVQNRVNVSSFNNNLYSWENAPARTLCNNRLLFGLPIQLQSILCKSQVSSYPTEYYVENAQSGGIYRRPEYCITTRDYLFAYSVSNIVANNSDYEQEDLINSPFAWRIPANVQLYDYDSSNTVWTNVNTNGNELVGQYFNLRFPYKPIQTSTIRIYRAEDGTAFSSNPTIAASIGTDIIRSGDIYLEGTNAYIYVSNQEINAYGLNAYLVRDYARFNGLVDNDVTHIDSTSLGRGGWISATNYWTRSLISGGTSYTKFADVSVDGSVNISNVSTDTYGEKVSYILTI